VTPAERWTCAGSATATCTPHSPTATSGEATTAWRRCRPTRTSGGSPSGCATSPTVGLERRLGTSAVPAQHPYAQERQPAHVKRDAQSLQPSVALAQVRELLAVGLRRELENAVVDGYVALLAARSSTVRADHASRVRFSATVGQEPEVELAIV
jgi:hypothetical protein